MQKRALGALQRASALFAAGRLEEARRACRKLLEMRPDFAEAHVLLGEIQRRSGDEARAGESLKRALKLRPGWSEAHLELTLGDLLGDQGQYAEAAAHYRAALKLQPQWADARYNLAGALNAMGRETEAATELQAVLRGSPSAVDAREQLLQLLLSLRRFDEMESVAREGQHRHPGASAFPRQLGIALWWLGHHEEALAAFRVAAEKAPGPDSDEYAGPRFLEANSLLALGRYAEGWDAYRWRRTKRALRKTVPDLVDDPRVIASLREPKRLRILSEQGLGDEIFFLRFAPALRERGHRLLVSCEPKLAPLLSGLVDAVNTDEAADFTLASGDLALASGQVFAPPLLLPVEAARRAAMQEKLRAFGPPPYIAVTWRAGLLPDEPKPQGVSYWAKQISPDLLGAALRSADARFVIMQRRPQREDMQRFTAALGREAIDMSAVNDDLREAVALLSVVNDYVGVSNTNVHLRAGLSQRSARILVFTPPEWRWSLNGSSTPWFPGFVVYRAVRGQDWSQALGQLSADLAAATQQK